MSNSISEPAGDKRHIIEQISADIFIYQDPEMLLDEPRKLIETNGINSRDLERYSWLILNIRYAWEKIKKYEKYFAVFYPPATAIDEIEALNHHLHAYLQDMDTFKNKIETLINQLKKDALLTALNKEEVIGPFSALSKRVTESFSEISDVRNKHTHHDKRFFDSDLLKAENAQNTALQLQSELVTPFLNQSVLPKALAKLDRDREKGFSLAKERWIMIAQINSSHTTNLLDMVMRTIKPYLYSFLRIKPTDVLFQNLHVSQTSKK